MDRMQQYFQLLMVVANRKDLISMVGVAKVECHNDRQRMVGVAKAECHNDRQRMHQLFLKFRT